MKTTNLKRIVSGITSSNIPTIGNYLGAMKRWSIEQADQDTFYFIANSHAITVRQDPSKLKTRSLDNYAWLLASGIDTENNTIFIQSMVSAHAELAWILNNYTMIGELNRMTQYKEKIAQHGDSGQIVGLYDYPVLMAADILLYSADEVPTGHDQKQHIELTRNIAERFNHIYGVTFKVPKPVISDVGARIMNLANPDKKMSKSDPSVGTVYLNEKVDEVIGKFKKAVTDSENNIHYDKKNKPAISNMLEIYQGFSGKTIKEIEKMYQNAGYGKFKEELGELVSGELAKLQIKFEQNRYDDNFMNIIEEGNSKARKIADKKLQEVKEKIGLL